jgi:hypothetical protein
MLTGTIPDTLLNLSEMILLDISFNKLSGLLPLSFPIRWSKMEQFTFGTNHLRGTLPDTIGTWKELFLLDFEFYNLQFYPNDIYTQEIFHFESLEPETIV